ncbi:hypothetical protein CANMA_001911 [Candida margitis]|uniref:uncharacterized protein n=1 Tax=Candida margitis TaxID=1775924 RepID=UPI0022279541|nr:uncharacterized protein CANMA_001911 [Candida margitis]KAI5969059.1 hypothetical protein CANMA_001911 [Candida margitis]
MRSYLVAVTFSPIVSSLFIDTSNYSPYPPSSDQPSSIFSNATTTIQDQQQFPYTFQYSKLYGKQVVECMKQTEVLFTSKVSSCAADTALLANPPSPLVYNDTALDCQCLFMKYIDDNCFDIGLNDNGLWELEKLDYPVCKFST